jgi:hypothetical protein
MSWLVLCQILLDKFILRGVGARSAPTPLKINLSRFDIKVAGIEVGAAHTALTSICVTSY